MKKGDMETGDAKWAVIPQANSVIVIDVVLDYECDGLWECHEPRKTVVRDGRARKSSWSLPADDLFSTEQAAINEAKRRKPTGQGKKHGS